MPRPNAPRSVQSEAAVAERISYERERRGWSYDTLAKRMTDAGCPIHASAILKIEKGDPPRRITIDEAVALRAVFDLESLDELVTPLDLVQKRHALAVVQDLDAAEAQLGGGLVGVLNGYIEYFRLVLVDRDLAEFIDNRRAQTWAAGRADGVIDGGDDELGAAVASATVTFYKSLIKAASGYVKRRAAAQSGAAASRRSRG